MLKLILLTLLISFQAMAKPSAPEHTRKNKWDVSPIQIQYLTAFFTIELLVYNMFTPEFVKQEVKSSDYDFDKDEISVPSWAYQLGNYGPEILTLGTYGYYLFGNDKESFEKAFVFTESVIISQGITFGTKYAVNKQRPDQSDYLSLPSGHATHAFSVGTWLSLELFHSDTFYQNYWIASIPLLYSSYIGWSRVDGNKHSIEDVSLGAFVGGLTSYLMYSYHFDDRGRYRFPSKSKTVITPTIDPINERYSINIGVML